MPRCSASSGCFWLQIVSACFGVVQMVFEFFWIVLGCPGCLRLFRLFWAALGCVWLFGVVWCCVRMFFDLFMLFQVVWNCSGC